MIPKFDIDRRNILIIEDEESLCELLQDELSAIGYKVFIARNGSEGLKRMQEIEPDVIICDRLMPGMSGTELLTRLRGVYPQYKHVPFIFLTALGASADQEAVESLKPAAYLVKPLDFAVLRKTIEKVLGKA